MLVASDAVTKLPADRNGADHPGFEGKVLIKTFVSAVIGGKASER